MRRGWGAILFAGSLLLSALGIVLKPAPEWRFATPQFEDPLAAGQGIFQTVFDHAYPQGNVHSANIMLLEDGFRVIWFQGTREGARDVEIVGQDFDVDGRPVRDIHVVLSAGAAQEAITPAQAVYKLGNTVQFSDGNDLLATVVSVGGWSFASIALIWKDGEGNMTGGHRLPLSPFFNRSHLVRSATKLFENGDIALPAYLEVEQKQAELIRLTPDGRVIARRRITTGELAIQPDLAIFDPLNAVALMRNVAKTGKLVASWTEDGGDSWSPPELLDIPNLNAPVASLALDENTVLMAYNPAETHSNSLALAVSGDRGRTWRQIYMLEDNGDTPGSSTRYPALQRLPDGKIVLAYSRQFKRGIRVIVLDEAWVRSR